MKTLLNSSVYVNALLLTFLKCLFLNDNATSSISVNLIMQKVPLE